MRFRLILLFALTVPLTLRAQQLPPASTVIEHAGISIPVYEGFEALAPLFAPRGDTTVIVNFWATWCAPCVEELPYFEELTRRRTSEKYLIILVNLDFRKQLSTRLIPFLEKHELQSTVVVLDDPDANAWIDRIDPTWSGAIPATVIFNAARREFREQSFTSEELTTLVTSFTGHAQ